MKSESARGLPGLVAILLHALHAEASRSGVASAILFARPMGLLIAVVAVLVLVVIALCVLGYSLLLQNGKLLTRIDSMERELRGQGILPPEENPRFRGMPGGSVLNNFCLAPLYREAFGRPLGEAVTLAEWKGKRLLIAFVQPGCPFSLEFIKSLDGLIRDSKELPAMPLLITKGGTEQNKALFDTYTMRVPVLLQEDAELATVYRIPGTPSGYLVDEKGATAGPILNGAGPLLGALAAPAHEKAASRISGPLAGSKLLRDGLKSGTPAPDFVLPALKGGEVSLRQYLGRRVLLVFSDPECQPCNRVAQELEKIHRKSRGPQVLMISRGERSANEGKAAEYGLTFPIVLQKHWEISKAYGIFATPVGYLIDESGVIVSGVAVGADPILQLAR